MVGSMASGGRTVGAIVISPFPFTNLVSIKRRPVLVVASAGPQDWVVCQITGSPQGRPGDIAITQQDMQTGVLERNSWVRPAHLHTIAESLFSPAVGRLSNIKLAEITATLRSLV